MQMEPFLDELLKTCYNQETVNIYDVATPYFCNDSEGFTESRNYVQHLVKSKLVNYADEENTQLKITNYGRFWMAKGGYFTYLKEGHELKEKRTLDKEAHQERLLEARLKLTKYRLFGFWVALFVSALGLGLSVFNLFLFLAQK